MKRFLFAVAIAAAILSPAAQAADVGVSVSIGQPGFYGRLDIGGFPAPVLLYPEPVMIQAVPYGRPPLYLRVPPGHAKHWHKYCHRYHACGERVYFVRDEWYQREYSPVYRERHYGHRDYDRRDFHNERRHEIRHERREDWREDRRDDRHDRRHDRRDERRDDRHDRHDDDRGHGRGRDH
ncbi:MAG: hypothetical protein KA538_03670 [Azonexus sp.]|jgi:hypothetical protein|nr:hypothetical protein [Azonexus sp.]